MIEKKVKQLINSKAYQNSNGKMDEFENIIFKWDDLEKQDGRKNQEKWQQYSRSFKSTFLEVDAF